MSNKEIRVTYEYGFRGDLGGYIIYRELPHRHSKLTGKYRLINGEMEVEVSEWFLFGWRSRWIGERCFSFTEIKEFSCHE